ncbi:actin maturation protease-like isoform X1 [Uloborus diversus]|uniref:actin maturation protease-like isoform X1 n=1 Tax=Uloborus diversus TaxID=327109 RepID=UPI002409B548|nr:actin maturation protease-like isoform X1 [Uloborus diversus]
MQNPPLRAQSPPPPPPPPLPPSASSCMSLSNIDKGFVPNTEVNSIHSHNLLRFQENIPSNNSGQILAFNKPVNYVLQSGRTCGVVALSMASQLIKNVDPDTIYMSALIRGFSKGGELFSAYNVAVLAEDLLNCDAEVLSDLHSQKSVLLNHLCDGWPVLIPYDADKNHFPCLNNGLSAHWAVITGLCFPVAEDLDLTSVPGIKTKVGANIKLCHVKEGQFLKPYLDFSTNMHVYAHQGKSRYMSVWNLDRLLDSNLNMYEVGKKFLPDELVLPENDALSELRNKAVLLKKKAS